MFPNDEDYPSIAAEPSADSLVPRDVALNFRLPPSVQIAVEVVTLPAAVPKAAIHEDNAPPAHEDQVWTTREASSGTDSETIGGHVSESDLPEGRGDAAFRSGATTIGLHCAATLILAETITPHVGYDPDFLFDLEVQRFCRLASLRKSSLQRRARSRKVFQLMCSMSPLSTSDSIARVFL